MASRSAAFFRRSTLFPRALLVLLWAAAAAVMAFLAGRFWIPLDDGTLAQSAERVLLGQLPHRDFGDPYSGLGAFVGAAALKLLGVRLWSLRVPLVAGFAIWLPAVRLLARRHLPTGSALIATALAAVLSVPAYPAAMPGWYALFAVTWGAWMLAQALEGGARGWLVGAGAIAGVAVLFKVVGLYFLAAALLSLAWRRAERSRVYAAGSGVAVVTFLLLLGRLTLPGAG
ncbi:MAG: glycosyltransferase family 39 protein, partial [Gemmatimonadetes bacterium]|nr:glycosyltransferase family 39 protein [Gemmatimonadota bacterium]